MKKKMVTLVLATALVASLAACGGAPKAEPAKAETKAETVADTEAETEAAETEAPVETEAAGALDEIIGEWALVSYELEFPEDAGYDEVALPSLLDVTIAEDGTVTAAIEYMEDAATRFEDSWTVEAVADGEYVFHHENTDFPFDENVKLIDGQLVFSDNLEWDYDFANEELGFSYVVLERK